MYKISSEAVNGMHADPKQLGNTVKIDSKNITKCQGECPFDVSIKVLPSTLTPLELEDFNIEAWDAWYNDSTNILPYITKVGKPGKEEILFEIKVLLLDVQELYFEVCTLKTGQPIQTLQRWQVTKQDKGTLKEGTGSVPVGTYQWHWDGYIGDTLSTKILKDEQTYIRAIAVKGSYKEDAVQLFGMPFDKGCELTDWVDVEVNRGGKTVDVEWRVAFDDWGVKGKKTAATPSFQDLKTMAINGIRYHWKGSIITTKGQTYQVNFNPVVTTVNAIPSLTLEVSTKLDYERSVNSSCACGTPPFTADFTKVWYLEGVWAIQPGRAQVDFEMTAAHECGHAVLASYAYKSRGLSNYSWVHKGSSTGFKLLKMFVQYETPKKGEKGYEPYKKGDIVDLMKYYRANLQGDYPNELDFHATEYDIKSMIWLTRVDFAGGIDE